MERIRSEANRQVCCTKRRKGLYKMASELSIFCGTEIGIVVFSPGGKPYSFGCPSVDAVLDRYLAGNPNKDGTSMTAADSALVQELHGLAEVERTLEEAVKGGGAYWWDRNVDSLGLVELEEHLKKLNRLKNTLAMLLQEISPLILQHQKQQKQKSSSDSMGFRFSSLI